MNHLYYGDNLSVLRDSIASDSVDLIYLDPPFNSNASYNVLFKDAARRTAQTLAVGLAQAPRVLLTFAGLFQ